MLQIVMYRPYTKAVDWWSFGVLLYEMLAGMVSPIYIIIIINKSCVLSVLFSILFHIWLFCPELILQRFSAGNGEYHECIKQFDCLL